MTPAKFIRKIVLGLTQSEFSQKFRVNQSTAQRWEAKGVFPHWVNLELREKHLPKGFEDAWFFIVPANYQNESKNDGTEKVTTQACPAAEHKPHHNEGFDAPKSISR